MLTFDKMEFGRYTWVGQKLGWEKAPEDKPSKDYPFCKMSDSTPPTVLFLQDLLDDRHKESNHAKGD